MLVEIYPLQVLLLTVSGVVNRHQANVIAYLVEENRVLTPDGGITERFYEHTGEPGKPEVVWSSAD